MMRNIHFIIYSSQSAKREKDLMHAVENNSKRERAEALTLTQERHRSYRPSTETNATSQP